MAVVAGIIGGATAVAVGASVGVAIAVGVGTALVMDYTIDSMEEASLEAMQGQTDTMGGRNVTTKNPTAVRDIVYGKTRKGGTIVYQSVVGVDGRYDSPANIGSTEDDFVSRLNFIICWHHTVVHAVREIYLDDTLAFRYENGSNLYKNQYASNGTSSVHGSDFYVHNKFGNDPQGMITIPYDGSWDSSVVNNKPLNGIAYSRVTFIHNPDKYPNGVPKVTALIEGKKVYDPRSQQTAWSDNPVLCLYNYLRNSDFGADLSGDLFDINQIEDAADFCDENVTIGGVTRKRYSCNGVISTQDSVRTNIKKILSCMKGKMVFINGKFKILPKRYLDPHDTVLNEDMIIGDFIISNKNPRQVAFNEVRGNFVSAEANYVKMEYPPQKNTSYQTDDGDRYRKNLDLPMTTDIHQAQRLAKLTLTDSRRERTLKTTINARGLDYAIGDTINVTNSALGITNQKYEITNLQINISDASGITIDLEGRETNDAIDNQTGTYFDFDRSTSLLPDKSVIRTPRLRRVDVVPYYENQFAYTGISLIWFAPYGVNVNYYRVGIGDPNEDFETYKIYTTTETTLLIPNYDETANIRIGVQAVNQHGMKSIPSYETITNGNEFADITDTTNIIYTRLNITEPTDAEYEDYFGRPPRVGDEITIIKVDYRGKPIDAETYRYKQDIQVHSAPFNKDTFSRDKSLDVFQQFGFTIDNTEVGNADITWSHSIQNYTSNDGSTAFPNVNTSTTFYNGVQSLNVDVRSQIADHENKTPADGFLIYNTGDLVVTADYTDENGIDRTQSVTKSVTLHIGGYY